MASSMRGAFAVGDFVDAVVSYVEGPRKFYVQLLSAGTELRNLTKRLHVLYNTSLLGEPDLAMTLDHLATSMRSDQISWCAAPFQIEGLDADGQPYPAYYYRAAVLSRAGPSTVKVFFVDYGNTAVVPIASLKMLPKTYQEIPIMAVPCRLVEGEVGDTNIIDPASFRTVVDGFHVVVQVSPINEANTGNEVKPPSQIEPLWVSLFVTDGKEEANVGETLLNDVEVMPNANSH